MGKLLSQYAASPTYKNAQKVRAYERSHPMAVCMLDRSERDLLASAISHANQGRR